MLLEIWPFLFCIRQKDLSRREARQTFFEISNGRKVARIAPIDFWINRIATGNLIILKDGDSRSVSNVHCCFSLSVFLLICAFYTLASFVEVVTVANGDSDSCI